MEILHINSYYSGSHFYKNFYDKQVELGLSIDVYVPINKSISVKNKDFGDFTKISRNHSKGDRFLFHLKHKKIYKDITQNYITKKYDIIHAHSLFSNGYIAYRLKEKYGIPYIVTVRNTDVNTFFKKMIHLRKLGLKILHNADKVIFLSQSYKDQVLNRYVPEKYKIKINKKISIIPNGIDDYWFCNLNKPKKLSKETELKLLYIGAINKNKNIITTMEVVKNLTNKGMKIEFTAVGKIEDKKIFNLIKDYQFFKYIPPKPKEELIEIYRSNDIFIMPSIRESFGLVYAEAMSQGLPIIYTKNQGFDNQFENGVNGYSIDPMSVNDISNKIIEINQKYEAISLNVINNVEKFKWVKISAEYSEIYRDILTTSKK